MAKLSNIKCIDSLIYKSNDKVAKTRPPLMNSYIMGGAVGSSRLKGFITILLQ